MKTIIMAASAVIAMLLVSPANAKQKYSDANGNVVSHKTGARATVGAAYAARFQAYIDDLEQNYGAVVKFIGGIRRGKCWSGGLHPCGKALDVCQLSRGKVDSRCRLPSPQQEIIIAERHGLTSGAIWCHSDYGHIQVGMTAGPCGSSLGARNKRHYAKRRYQRLAKTL